LHFFTGDGDSMLTHLKQRYCTLYPIFLWNQQHRANGQLCATALQRNCCLLFSYTVACFTKAPQSLLLHWPHIFETVSSLKTHDRAVMNYMVTAFQSQLLTVVHIATYIKHSCGHWDIYFLL
jgi:hypothetical protein